MSNIFHQSVEDILRAATPEQRILWNYVFLRWGERVPIAQLYYNGNPAGTEFLTYSARKIYIAYSLFMSSDGVALATIPQTLLRDDADVTNNSCRSLESYWDATAAAARFVCEQAVIHNVWFSRLIPQGHNGMTFIGYRISI